MTQLGRRMGRVAVELGCGDVTEVLALLGHCSPKGLAAVDSGIRDLSYYGVLALKL